MIRTERLAAAIAAALLVAAVGLVAGAARATDGADEPQQKMKLNWIEEGSKDGFEVENLDLAVGESREVRTESGKQVTITRNDEGYTVAVDGETLDLGIGGGTKMHKIFISDGGEGDTEGVHRRVHRIEIAGKDDGEHHAFVVGDGDQHMLKFVGEDGVNGFAFRSGDGEMPLLPHQHLLDRIEKSEKFLALDDTTREIVREVIRDAAPKNRWVERGEGEPGETIDVIIERKSKNDDD